MVQRVSSSIGDTGTENQSLLDEERPILVNKNRPRLLGANVTAVMLLVYFFTIGILTLHLAVVLGCSFRIKGGYVITLMFGILGPIPIVYWILSIMYIIYGAIAFIRRQRDFWEAASLFRRWTRISRYLMVAMISALVNMIFGSGMFVYGTSLEYNLKYRLQKLGYDGVKKDFLNLYAKIHDEFISSQVNMHQPFPLNVLISLSVNWGWAIVVILVPPLILYIGIRAQESYYTWRFGHTGIKID
jgi:hypothetical protein